MKYITCNVRHGNHGNLGNILFLPPNPDEVSVSGVLIWTWTPGGVEVTASNQISQRSPIINVLSPIVLQIAENLT